MESDVKHIVVTHFYASGPAQFLNRYLKERGIPHRYIEHPFIFSNRKYSIYSDYFGGKAKIKNGIKIPKVELLYYFRDFIGTLFNGLRCSFDIGLGCDNLNTLALLFLKKLGRIRKVVYITVDYTPVRFTNKIMNFIYQSIDKFCCYNADVLWDSAKVMRPARMKNGTDVSRIRQIIVVPDGNDFDKDKIKDYQEITKYKLVYMGHVRENQGVDLLIDSVSELYKWNEKISLLIIGGGDKLAYFKQYVINKGLNNIVSFTGYVENHKIVQDMLRRCYLAFALYKNDPNSYSKYSAVGKPLVYMGCGLPVIITDVPEIARRIDRFGAGKIVEYKKEEVIEKVKEIINNKKLYLSIREKAIKFARNNTWDKIFDKAFKETRKLLN